MRVCIASRALLYRWFDTRSFVRNKNNRNTSTSDFSVRPTTKVVCRSAVVDTIHSEVHVSMHHRTNTPEKGKHNDVSSYHRVASSPHRLFVFFRQEFVSIRMIQQKKGLHVRRTDFLFTFANISSQMNRRTEMPQLMNVQTNVRSAVTKRRTGQTLARLRSKETRQKKDDDLSTRRSEETIYSVRLFW